MLQKEVSPSQNRWFIWTIVFLIVSGIALVSYIMIDNINQDTQNYEILSAKH